MSIYDFAEMTILLCLIGFFSFVQKFNQPQKTAGICFPERMADYSAYHLRAKNFIEIILSHTISEINVFLLYKQKSKITAKNGVKIIFEKKKKTWQMNL